MSPKKLPTDFQFLPDMYSDQYFPKFLVDKVTDLIKGPVVLLEEGGHTREEMQEAFDQMTLAINELQDDFLENDSEIETGARESIGETIDRIIEFFGLDIDSEEAIRERDW